MKAATPAENTTTITERGQTAIPAQLRRAYRAVPGSTLIWEAVGHDEWRVRLVRKPLTAPDPREMLGFARRFRPARSTQSWLDELRDGERE